MDFRELKLKQNLSVSLDFEMLKDIYLRIVKDFNSREVLRTSSELEVISEIKKSTQLRFIPSVWIGKRNIDLFCCAIRGLRSNKNDRFLKGIAIEVDGDIHNLNFKMKKDNSKYRLLDSLDIALYTIENGDIRQPSVQTFLKELKRFPRLDSRGRKRVWRNIYLYTVLSNLDHPIVQEWAQEHKIFNLVSLKRFL